MKRQVGAPSPTQRSGQGTAMCQIIPQEERGETSARSLRLPGGSRLPRRAGRPLGSAANTGTS
eukprot:scaffold5536_cov359-Prasinococcus_capsulatus_cf.AAC.3